MQQIGPYALARRIGAGGMAEVWLAHRATLGVRKTLAVKLLAPNLACKAQYRQLFFEEARLSMLLNHSNIVQVFDFGEDRGECYIAMEWIDGVNLAELQGALWGCGRSVPVEVAMYITGEVLRALEYAHNLAHDGATSIVHRDVSPANIMLSLAGEVKLADFGVARFGSEETSGVHVKGKLRYMAPEQLRGHSKAGSVDIFSAGAVLHEMIDGRKFRSPSADEAQLIGSICTGTVPELGDPTQIPARLEQLRKSMLAADPEQRTGSARAALRSLRDCPGYRHAAHELEALVGWYRRVEPRHFGYRPMSSMAGEVGDGGGHDETWCSLAGSSAARLASTRRPTERRRRAAAITVALGGLCIGCLGVGMAVRNLDDRVDRVDSRSRLRLPAVLERHSLDHALRMKARPVTSAPTIVATSNPPIAEPPFEFAPEPVALASELALEPEPAPPREARHPVEVRFVAGTFQFAYLKVAHKQLLIEPDGKLALPPGVHRVHVRFSPDQEWRYFGKIHIRPDRVLLVKLVEPGGLEVRAQE